MNSDLLVNRLEGRLSGLRNDRYSWWVHWRELADFILPRRYKWLITPNQWNRGSPINQHIIDSTGSLAARVCSSGMMAGITSPTRPWFKLRISGMNNSDDSNPVSLWLAEVEKRMMRVFSESNFYNSVAIVYQDLTVFGTSAMIIYEDFDDVIRCSNPALGEYFLANNDRGTVGTFYREFVQTVAQLVEWFGIENCSPAVQNIYREQNKAGLAQEVLVGHAIEPNTDRSFGVPPRFGYREIYWERGNTNNGKFLRVTGFYELPALCSRWDVVGNDAYGRGPGMDALPDIKQLQQEQKRKAQALDKLVNPPMVADIQLKNQPASLIPGGITYVNGMATGPKFAPAYQFQPPINELMLDIQQVQERIKAIFYNDLFMMISQLETVRTATEIDARREEKLVMLGPVLERFQNEVLDPAIERVYGIMGRAGLLPEAPPELEGQEVEIEYVSMLAEAQRAASSAGLERLFTVAGNLAAVNPEVLDNIDFDEGLDEYASLLSVAPRVIRDKAQVEMIRQQRAGQQKNEQMLMMTDAAVKGAKTLSDTEVGGGINALQAMMGG